MTEINIKLKSKQLDYLFKALLTLKSVNDCYNFFEDLCTATELKAMAQRVEVARMLREKKAYADIVKNTGASTATISRVNRCLMYGADGYNMVFERLEKND